MAIRLSGMVSGLDTDALVKELVSAYSTKKDNFVKAQTKTQWKMDAWKSMNSQIYGFYSGSLSSMRFSSQYNLKTTSVSNSSAATVTASSSAVNGTQSLKIKSIAATGYLTGGKLNIDMDGDSKADKVEGSTKLADIGIKAGSKINVNGEELEITSDMTVDKFTAALKDKGVNASFDATNQRFFISSKESGADAEFTLTAGNADGLGALQNLGLFAAKDINGEETSDMKEYRRLAALDDGSEASNIAKAVVASVDKTTTYSSDQIASFKSTISAYDSKMSTVNAYESAQKKAKDYFDQQEIIDNNKDNIDSLRAKLVKEQNDEGEDVKYTDAEIKDMKKFIEDNKEKVADLSAEDLEKFNKYTDITTAYDTVNQYDAAEKYVAENADAHAENEAYLADNKAAYDAAKAYVDDADNAQAYNAAKTAVNSAAIADVTTGGTGAARITGKDSEIELNGATFTSNTGSYSINGLSITAMQVTGDDPITITTSSDTKGVYDKVKNFINDYNKLLSAMNTSYNAESSGKYEPLTDDEKEAMTDDQIEKWEKKIKDALLRRDSTLGAVTSAMSSAMAGSYTVNGKTYSLASFGINTSGYFSADANERGLYHIDGNSEDSKTAGNADKLMAAINEDPEGVVEFFQQLANKVYTDLSNKMSSSSVSSAYTIYNDKQMSSEYSTYKDKISKWEEKLKTIEDSYYKKFSAMEKAMSELQSKTQQLGSMLGGGY